MDPEVWGFDNIEEAVNYGGGKNAMDEDMDDGGEEQVVEEEEQVIEEEEDNLEEERDNLPLDFDAGDRSVVVMEGGGLRVVVPNPDMTDEEYFNQNIGEEEEEEMSGEEERQWRDGTVVQM